MGWTGLRREWPLQKITLDDIRNRQQRVNARAYATAKGFIQAHDDSAAILRALDRLDDDIFDIHSKHGSSWTLETGLHGVYRFLHGGSSSGQRHQRAIQRIGRGYRASRTPVADMRIQAIRHIARALIGLRIGKRGRAQ